MGGGHPKARRVLTGRPALLTVTGSGKEGRRREAAPGGSRKGGSPGGRIPPGNRVQAARRDSHALEPGHRFGTPRPVAVLAGRSVPRLTKVPPPRPPQIKPDGHWSGGHVSCSVFCFCVGLTRRATPACLPRCCARRPRRPRRCGSSVSRSARTWPRTRTTSRASSPTTRAWLWARVRARVLPPGAPSYS